MNAYLLRNLDSNLHGFTPSDKILILREVTLDANGRALVNFGDIFIKKGAPIYFTLLGTTGSFGFLEQTINWEGLSANSFDVPISISAEDDTDQPIDIPAANKTVMALFIIPNDYIMSNNR